ncbi:putative amino-acid metabolite efflux pump [Anaerotignum neopropionicum]|uniref:Putative amino-acid metabolite efflux pump n=1 Tax=Anaerotignum neopropionicum TaxID=36847 RepID=A0A136WF31_9FIRM|nr:DMT family transporter [Anaerotignum neopropionicum]KXL53111.1 putative amino-acid metabolite efflux pump [Anaerotignum neopropionicum]
MSEKKETTGHLLTVMTIIVWGTTFISTKVLLQSMTPVEILFIRFAIGWIALSLVYPHRLRFKERKQEMYFAAAGLCGITLYYLLENIALMYTFASNVGVIISIAPFFTAVFAHVFLKEERLTFQFFVGFLIAFTGVFLISFNGFSVLKLNPRGDILAVLAAVVWSVYSILTKKIGEFQYNTIQTTRRIFFYGLVFMLPSLKIFQFNPSVVVLIQPTNLFNILFLGLGASALCFVTWNAAVRILGAVKTSVYIYLVPVITIATSIIVLKERITGMAMLGVILTLTGLFISENRITFKTKEGLNNE